MGCINTKEDPNKQRVDRRSPMQTRSAAQNIDTQRGAQAAKSASSVPRDIRPSSSVQKSSMVRDADDTGGRSIERRHREHAMFNMIVQNAGDTFIDVRQSALDFEPEDATDATAQEFSRDIRDTRIDSSAVTIHGLPKPDPSNVDNLFFNLAVPPVPRDKLDLINQTGASIASAVSNMKIQYSGEPVVVHLSEVVSGKGQAKTE